MPCRRCQISWGVSHRQGVAEEAVALGVKTAGLQSTPLQAAMPHTTHQMVVDIRVAGGSDKDQPIRGINPQLLHLSFVLLQGLQHLGGQWHHTLSPCLGGSPLHLAAGIPITPQALADQHLAFFPTDAIPGQTPDFGITQPRAESQQKQRVIPGLVGLQVSQHRLDFFHAQHIALH